MGNALRDLGTAAGYAAAILGFVIFVSKLPPVRWLGRRLITEPLQAALRGVIREEMDRTNGGSTLMDKVIAAKSELTNLSDQLTSHTEQDAENFKAIQTELSEIRQATVESN